MEHQIVELHFSQLPYYDWDTINVRAEEILGDKIDTSGSKGDSFSLFHKQHLVKYTDGGFPVQTAIITAHQPINIQCYVADIEQSWGFRDCEAVLKQSCHTLLVIEMMAKSADPIQRTRLFHGVLQAVIEVTQPDSLVFRHSQQVVRPDMYLAAVDEDPIMRPGSMNVRFFNIANSDGDMLMDTRGLHEIGLHDLQCHFRDLDPNDVSNLLFNTAIYIFENGAVIESGNTVAGVAPNSKWVCQFEDSLLEPKRELLDLNPGFPYAAGNRQ
jgi:Domain of unknown function (DUF4261)